jgi:putative NIF3 family GTP cyclohydrolase 1 type 2
VFVTGDVSYHDADKAQEAGVALIVAPHGELEWLVCVAGRRDSRSG